MREPDIEIDDRSGFCFGVINAIKKAEEQLANGGALHSLGDIVHNGEEVKRLADLGLQSISHDRLSEISGRRILFRAHGEAPEVYERARERGLEIIDATCPVVLRLQKNIRETFEGSRKERAQIVIFGKEGHAEVIGLVGQTSGEAIVVQTIDQVRASVDPERPIYLFSQTTMSREKYAELIAFIEEWKSEGVTFRHHDTICRQVSNRVPDITAFSKSKDWVYFIAGRNSSNGKWLYETAKRANPHTVFISSPDEITEPLPAWVKSVGICGATSTPVWQMEAVAKRIRMIAGQQSKEE